MPLIQDVVGGPALSRGVPHGVTVSEETWVQAVEAYTVDFERRGIDLAFLKGLLARRSGYLDAKFQEFLLVSPGSEDAQRPVPVTMPLGRNGAVGRTTVAPAVLQALMLEVYGGTGVRGVSDGAVDLCSDCVGLASAVGCTCGARLQDVGSGPGTTPAASPRATGPAQSPRRTRGQGGSPGAAPATTTTGPRRRPTTSGTRRRKEARAARQRAGQAGSGDGQAPRSRASVQNSLNAAAAKRGLGALKGFLAKRAASAEAAAKAGGSVVTVSQHSCLELRQRGTLDPETWSAMCVWQRRPPPAPPAAAPPAAAPPAAASAAAPGAPPAPDAAQSDPQPGPAPPADPQVHRWPDRMVLASHVVATPGECGLEGDSPGTRGRFVYVLFQGVLLPAPVEELYPLAHCPATTAAALVASSVFVPAASVQLVPSRVQQRHETVLVPTSSATTVTLHATTGLFAAPPVQTAVEQATSALQDVYRLGALTFCTFLRLLLSALGPGGGGGSGPQPSAVTADAIFCDLRTWTNRCFTSVVAGSMADRKASVSRREFERAAEGVQSSQSYGWSVLACAHQLVGCVDVDEGQAGGSPLEGLSAAIKALADRYWDAVVAQAGPSLDELFESVVKKGGGGVSVGLLKSVYAAVAAAANDPEVTTAIAAGGEPLSTPWCPTPDAVAWAALFRLYGGARSPKERFKDGLRSGKGKGKGKGARAPRRCGHCREVGHTKTTCQAKASGQPPVVTVAARPPRRCGWCRQVGHTQARCAEKADGKPQRPQVARAPVGGARVSERQSDSIEEEEVGAGSSSDSDSSSSSDSDSSSGSGSDCDSSEDSDSDSDSDGAHARGTVDVDAAGAGEPPAPALGASASQPEAGSKDEGAPAGGPRRTSKAKADGLRAGRALQLRYELLAGGATLKSGGDPSLAPMPPAKPVAIPFPSDCVLPVLRRALDLARAGVTEASQALEALGGAGDASTGTASAVADLGSARDCQAVVEGVLQALPADGASLRRLGVTPLFNPSHRPVRRLLARFGCLPATCLFNGPGGGASFPFPTVGFSRRLEGVEPKPARFVKWGSLSSAWARAETRVGTNGAGVKAHSTSMKDFVNGRPGAYSINAVPIRWRPRGRVLAADPGVRIILAFR